MQKLVVETIAIVTKLEPQHVAMDSELATLGLDSLGLFTVLGCIEAAIGIELDVDETIAAMSATTVAGMAASLAAAAASRQAAEAARGVTSRH